MEQEEAREVVDGAAVERVAAPIYVPGAVRQAKTSKYKLDDGSVVLPIAFEYKPMTDLEQAKHADRMRRAQKVEDMREAAYHVLSQHVLKVEIEGFEPHVPQSWRAFICGEIVQEMLGIIRGDGKKVEDDDLKN